MLVLVLVVAKSTMVGEMLLRGLLPGRMKFEGEGMKPKALDWLGMLKSFISLLRMMPVWGTTSWEPKRRFMVVVREIERPVASAVTRWDVPPLFFLVGVMGGLAFLGGVVWLVLEGVGRSGEDKGG